MIRRMILLAGMAAVYAPAQAPEEPFALIRLIRRPPLPADTDQISEYAKSQAGVNVFGMNSVSGPAETWFIEGHDSFASIEAVDTALANARRESAPLAIPDAVPLMSSAIALYLPGLSYRPEEAIKLLPKARYLNIAVYRIRAGMEAEFSELMRTRRRALDAVNLDRPEIAYRVISGAPAGTYIVVSPLTSLKLMDNGLARNPAYANALAEVPTPTDGSRIQILFRLEPRSSYVSDDIAAQDSGFWRR